MQKLHLVGFTTDHRGLILSARRGARSGGFLLEIDDAVATAMADARARVDAEAAALAPPRPQSTLSVRELQARLRAGRSIDDVAADAGVDPEWVARFAPPVLAEQARVVDTARAATLSRARRGPSALPLGAAVRHNLADRGVVLTTDELEGSWSARQVDDSRWVVTLRYRSRGRVQAPSWELDARTGEVGARDRLAGELAFVAHAGRPARPVAPPARAKKRSAAAAKREQKPVVRAEPRRPDGEVPAERRLDGDVTAAAGSAAAGNGSSPPPPSAPRPPRSPRSPRTRPLRAR